MSQCFGIWKVTGEPCTQSAKHNNPDGLDSCYRHKHITTEEMEKIKEHAQELVQFRKEREANEKLNQQLLKEHPSEIPLKDFKHKIVGFAQVSPEDYDRVNKHKWHMSGHKDRNDWYVQGKIDSQQIKLHHFIIGKPPENMVVDHIDNNRLNNRRENLRFASVKQNAQNKSMNNGKYMGVQFEKKTNRWVAMCARKSLGTYDTEEEAAKAYDQYVLKTYGDDAKTNILKPGDDEAKLEPKTQERKNDLPKFITTTYGKFRAGIVFENRRFISSLLPTIQEAVANLEKFKKEIEGIKQQKREEHFNKPITRNSKGDAVIIINDKNGNIIDEAIVPEDRWHELTQYKWWKSDNYYFAVINKKNVALHRYLVDAKKGQIVDHANNHGKSVNHNTLDNLRINDNSGNAHNKTKSAKASSQYFGVHFSKRDQNWVASIKKDKTYSLGNYKHEIQAAIAYNIYATKLYKEFANLNTISQEDLDKYENDIRTKLEARIKLASET